jgi:hypothetical protein
MSTRHRARMKASGLTSRSWLTGQRLVVAGMAAVFSGASAGAAQQPPPIQGVTGTIATEGTIQDTDEAGHKILVKAADGIERLFHLGKRSAVHGGDAAADETMRALKKGTRVVVHYTAEGEVLTAEEIDRLGEEGLKQIEGKVTAVNRNNRMISIKLANGTTQTLQLSDRAASDVGKDLDRVSDGTVTVVVYYKNEAGQRVVHYFKRLS